MRNPFALHSPDFKSNPAEGKMVVGAYLPSHLLEKLAVNSIVRGVPKSKIMELALTEYLQRNKHPSPQVVDIVVGRVDAFWKNYKVESMGKLNWQPSKEFEKYKQLVFKTLKKRGLPEDILEKVKQVVQTWSP